MNAKKYELKSQSKHSKFHQHESFWTACHELQSASILVILHFFLIYCFCFAL